jgi:hypothetical protein
MSDEPETDYEIDIRSVEPSYNHTLGRDAGREVKQGAEVHLTSLTVEIRIAAPRSDRSGTTFAATFRADHEAEQLVWKSIGDAFENDTSFKIDRLLTALGTAEEAAAAFCDDVGLEYDVTRPVASEGPIPTVHTALEVTDR